MNAVEQIIIDSSLIGDSETTGRIERFDAMLPKILEQVSGNIIEIGAGLGLSTRVFLKHARNFERGVFVIDPFEDGWNDMPESYGKPYPFDEFIKNIEPFEDWMHLLKMSSQEVRECDLITCFGAAFAFLDGLQTKSAIYRDLTLMENIGTQIICLDDIDRTNEYCKVPEAVNEFLKYTDNYKLITLPRKNIEGYLIRVK